MAYDIREFAERVNSLEPKTIIKVTDIMSNSDPNINKSVGRQVKADVDAKLLNLVSIGKDSANAQLYVTKP